jgi:hypothetical protein
MDKIFGKRTSAIRSATVAAYAGISALAGSGSAHADSYAMLVRQVDGTDAVPVHMICIQNKICRGVMSISVPGGHRRIFITAMIGGGNAYVGLRTEARDLSCSRREDFVLLALAPPPIAAHGYALTCEDAPPLRSHAFQDQGDEPASQKKLLAVLRIDLRSAEDGN